MGERTYPLRMVAWELTRNCNLSCIHCRASAASGPYEGELSVEECRKVIDDIVSFSEPTVILTGGEPLMRPDIFEIIQYGNDRGLRMVIAVNGTLLDEAAARRLKTCGIRRVSLSIDGKDRRSHDSFRAVNGSFEAVIAASRVLKGTGMPFQINTTVTILNVDDLDEIYEFVKSLEAVAWHVFLLVPVGRGTGLKGKELSAAAYEKVLHRLRVMERKNELEMKVTCAPHYYRIVKEDGETPKSAGCLAGKSFMFISHRGVAQPCGYLEAPSGDVRKEGVKKVWEGSEVFRHLRDVSSYQGKCGRCRHILICGGCRARAYEATGNYLEEEPLCSYMMQDE
ncbi:MAG: radical SAM protein [Syntrophorhabdaceae bacterium]|nr:radical SAM protein [Syntrophorhabdaceae bacterium]